MKKIFFSWQSDLKPVRNKIKRALEIAVKQIGQELEEAERPELDSDTQGEFGSEDIFNTILEKIDAADLFIADVTPITSTQTKLIPNPNVMVELGYALKTKQRNSRLFIYCSEEEIVVEQMPFDIRSKSLKGFNINDTPATIAAQLVPTLQGMLAAIAKTTSAETEYPYIYVDGASFQQWSDDFTATLNIKNTEAEEYYLEKIDIEGHQATPNRSLGANSHTSGISVSGVSQIFRTENPVIKMVLSRGKREHYIMQKIQVIKGADGLFHFSQFVQKPIPLDSFDE